MPDEGRRESEGSASRDVPPDCMSMAAYLKRVDIARKAVPIVMALFAIGFFICASGISF